MTARLRIMISCACAALTALSFVVYARSVHADAERERAEAIAAYGWETVELVVATRSMEAGEIPSSADVRTSEWIADLVPEGALTDADDAVGTALSVPIAKGAPFTSLNFRDATDTADVPSGYVAVTIPVNERLGVSREIVVGTKVVAFRVGDGEATIVADEAIVLSSPAAYSSSLSIAQTMTLAVLPDSVSEVLLASSDSSLRIVLPSQGLSMEAEQSVPAPSDVEIESDQGGSEDGSAPKEDELDG